MVQDKGRPLMKRDERCTLCDEPASKAGRGEDSLYCDICEFGPFCAECWAEHMDEVIDDMTRAKSVAARHIAMYGEQAHEAS